MSKVNVIGAGFSGLIISYYLNRAGFEVALHEKEKNVGGLLLSPQTPFGLVEHAANGMLVSQELINLCKDINTRIIYPNDRAKNKYLYVKNEKVRWPFGVVDSIFLVSQMIRFKLKKERYRPKPLETLRGWGERVFSKKLVDYLLEPAFLGVYANTANELSAQLVTGSFFKAKNKNTQKIKRQTVTFDGGMNGFCNALLSYLVSQGVNYSSASEVKKINEDELNIVSVGLSAAQNLFKEINSEVYTQLSRLNLLSIAKIACFTEELDSDGFGCLFARGESVNSLGVLFDSNLFPENYKKMKLQTWIMRPEAHQQPEELKTVLQEDLHKFWGQKVNVKHMDVKVWPQTLPNYDIELEKFLTENNTMQPIYKNTYLFANYCGDLGLSQIISRAQQLTEKL